ncbi:MAG: tetratricopeptide repeat protein [Desulfobulbaceae bacterium]
MAESDNGVKQQTLYISIAVALLVGFLGGIIYSDRSPQPGGQVVQQGMPPQQGQGAPQQEQLFQAIASLELAVQQNPNNAETWTQLGNAYFDTDQPAKAIEAYTKALAIIPGNPAVLTDLGVMYRRNNQPDKAVETFDQALKISPGFEQALFNKGVVLYNDLGKNEEAVKVWKELILINPQARNPEGTLVSEMADQLSKLQEKK